jgi:hypothetical protein
MHNMPRNHVAVGGLFAAQVLLLHFSSGNHYSMAAASLL